MEQALLNQFLRSVTRWPTTEAELNVAAERIGALIGAPLSIFYAVNPEERFGFKAEENGSEQQQRQPDLLKELTRRHIQQINSASDSSAERIRQIQIAPGASPGVPHSVRQIAVLPILSEIRIQPGVRDSRKKHVFGWLIIGSPKVLGSKEELALLMASQRLAELAVTSYFESQLQASSQFLSIASHELKTPLTAIYGVLQLQERMLRLGGQAGGQVGGSSPAAPAPKGGMQQSYLKMVIRQVERLNELIDGLLDVSRIQNGRFMVEPTEADVASILHEVVGGRLSVIAQEAGVKIQIDAPQALRASVDPVRIEEVLTNMIMNAIRFSPEGGVVSVKLRDEGGAFRLMVRDQGPAVAMEDRERIFQPFERAQRTSRLGGLGLGLFISRQIAQLHGGNVALVESVPGKGNLFEAYFPNRLGSQQAVSA